jgi:hypothetical protein
MREERAAGAGGGEGGEGFAEGVVAGEEAGVVAGDGRGEPAAVAEEPVAGISARKVAEERLWLHCRALSRMHGFVVTVVTVSN